MARANAWCGFLDNEHSQVRCGCTNLAPCKQAVGDSKEAICMPDPKFAAAMRRKNARS